VLILWDIDGTLLVTQRSGVEAMEAAGEELFGVGFSARRVAYAGRLDPAIVADLLRDNGVEPSESHIQAFRAAYRPRLEALMAQAGRARVLPGVLTLLGRISREAVWTQALLTGNWEETGSLKLHAAGIEKQYFQFGVWGDDSPIHPPLREHLPGVAMSRFKSLRGTAVDPRKVVIIGDTPNDVRCARVNDCRVIGVATGLSSRQELADAGADLAVDDLSNTQFIADWLATV
jgi:phosphoglycolate phosphatase